MTEPDVVVLDLTSSVRGQRYIELLQRDSMSVGVYRLAPGATDPQSPHAEDELYYVLAGRAILETPGKRTSVAPGTAVFVAKGVAHKFVEITSALEVLVFFAPAESG